MIHEIYNTLQEMNEELRAMRDIMEKKSGRTAEETEEYVSIITDYGDNQPCCEKLEILLSHTDWCRLRHQKCYRDLMIFLESLKIPGDIDIPDETETNK